MYLPSWSTLWVSILFGFSLLYSEAWSLITTWFRMWENKARRKAVAAVVWPEPKILNYYKQNNKIYIQLMSYLIADIIVFIQMTSKVEANNMK